jgi:hypothetical protein
MPEHVAVLAVLLLERPTCLDCVASLSGLSVTEADRYLTVVASSLELRRLENEHCRICGHLGPVFSVSRCGPVGSVRRFPN